MFSNSLASTIYDGYEQLEHIYVSCCNYLSYVCCVAKIG